MFLKRDSQSWPQNIRIISICVPIVRPPPHLFFFPITLSLQSDSQADQKQFLLLCLSIILAILGRRLYARRSFSRLNTIQVPNVYVENPYAPGLGGSAYLQRTDTYASQSNINDPESYLQNQRASRSDPLDQEIC